VAGPELPALIARMSEQQKDSRLRDALTALSVAFRSTVRG
jgi:hypothetical protein